MGKKESIILLRRGRARRQRIMELAEKYRGEMETLRISDAPSAVELTALMKNISVINAEFSKLADDIVNLGVAVDATEDELDADFKAESDLRDLLSGMESSVCALSESVHRADEPIQPDSQEHPVDSPGSTRSAARLSVNGNMETVRLPKLTLGSFDGDPLRWSEFWDQFESTVDRSELSSIDKMKYLRQALKGDAQVLAGGYSLTAASYTSVVQALKERYGSPEVMKRHHAWQLLGLPAATSDIKGLRRTGDQCEAHIRSLIALGMKEEEFSFMLIPLLLSKFPEEIRVSVERRQAGADWTLADLRKALNDELTARERGKLDGANKAASADVWNKADGNLPTEGHGATTPRATGEALLSTDAAHCAFCERRHASEDCRTVSTLSGRREKIAADSRCFCCLVPGHRSWRCRQGKPCGICHCHGHHSAICETRFGKS